jgi:hypothetical protein
VDGLVRGIEILYVVPDTILLVTTGISARVISVKATVLAPMMFVVDVHTAALEHTVIVTPDTTEDILFAYSTGKYTYTLLGPAANAALAVQ